MPKQELEFFDPTGLPWRRPEGYPEGAAQLIITKDEEGSFTRLMRFAPGTQSTSTLVHDCWEEVYIIEGELIAGDKSYTKGMVAVRPPGMPHGPFSSPKGVLMFEVHYYSRE
jgi:hypothetical protein